MADGSSRRLPAMARPPHPELPNTPFLVTASGVGHLSRKSTRSVAVAQPTRGLRIPTAQVDDLLARCHGIDLLSRDDSCLWGPTAAFLLGLPIPYRLETMDVHVMVPEDTARMRRPGVVSRQADIIDTEIVRVHGMLVTSAARTYTDIAWHLALPDIVAVGDAVLRDHALSLEELARVVGRRLRYPGKVKARAALPLLNPRSWSPQESRLRCHIALAGLPDPEVNGVITDAAGNFLACCDLVFRDLRVVVEYDGAVHADPEQRRKDAARRSLLRQHGWWVVEIVDIDLRDPRRALARIAAALNRAAR